MRMRYCCKKIHDLFNFIVKINTFCIKVSKKVLVNFANFVTESRKGRRKAKKILEKRLENRLEKRENTQIENLPRGQTETNLRQSH